MQENIRLSICMIVKNEERCLERCLKSLRPLREQLPCELIITDTGSTDRTLEIAEQYADKVLHFTWCNDFAAARNVGMEEAKGEWVMVLDADEELVEDVSPLIEFFNSEERHQYHGCHVMLKNCYEIDLLSHCESLKEYTGDMGSFLAYRIFNMAYHPRYVGEIHEAVPTRGAIYDFLNTILYHDGYAFVDEEAREKKKIRNATVLEQELKKDIHDLRLLVHIFQEESIIKKDVFKRLVEITEETVYHNLDRLYAPIAVSRVARYYFKEVNMQKALDICSKYVKSFKDKRCELFEIDIRYIQAFALFYQKQYKPALKFSEQYLTLVEKYETGSMDISLLGTGSFSFGSKRNKNMILWLQIMCYINLKNAKKAGELVRAMDMKTLTANVIEDYVKIIMRLIYIKDAEISLVTYYPILSRLRREGIGKQKEAAKRAYDFVHEHIKNAPEHIRTILLRQIASTKEGKRDIEEKLQEFQEKELQEKMKREEAVRKAEENLKRAIADTKETIIQLLAEPTMQEKAMDLINQLKPFALKDEALQQWIENLPV